MTANRFTNILCNGAEVPECTIADTSTTHSFDYLDKGSESANVRIGLPDFIRGVAHLPDRLLDLLEIAAYVYCADRMVRRGNRNDVEYHSWSRALRFVVRVRDFDFWARRDVSESLSRALEFMTGDRSFRFLFERGHATPPTGLFDEEQFQFDYSSNPSVLLFSGGLDSLAGAIQSLEETDAPVCLVSHQSQPGTIRTQNRLVDGLKARYPERISHYSFLCNLRGLRAVEETQRTRAFLYSSVAFSIAHRFGQNGFDFYENGVTSINFPRREDLSNARASRTTHPQTIYHLQEFYSLVIGEPFEIRLPFLWMTKADVVRKLVTGPLPQLLSSSVSCSKTFQNLGDATQCGGCSQCIDRRIAAYAAKADDWDDAGIYAHDVIANTIEDGDVKTTAVDYIRQARKFGRWNIDHFTSEMMSELAELVEYLPEFQDEYSAIEEVWNLCRRHGQQVAMGMKRMRDVNEDLYEEVKENSLLQLIADREYLKNPVERLVDSLCELLEASVARMFREQAPVNERDLNVKVNALLDSHCMDLLQEHPVVAFAGGHSIPDHGADNLDLVVEAKYIRGGTTPGRASEGMAADLTKYPQEARILFVVYDREHSIPDDVRFREDFESRGRCTVLIIR